MNENNKNEKDRDEKSEKSEKVSRRDFLAGSVGFAAGLAAGYTGVSEFLPPQEVEEVIVEGEIIERYTCPYTGSVFDSLEELKQNMVEEGLGNPVRMPTIKEVDEPHYEEMIVDDLERFEQKNQPYIRAVLEEDYRDRLLQASDLDEKPEGGWLEFITPEETLRVLDGFSQVDGGIYVDGKAGNPEYPAYGGFQGSQRSGKGLWGLGG